MESDKRLRIAMISYYLPSGSKIGVGYQVHALANEMVRRGHRVTVFSACGPSVGAAYETERVPLRGGNRTFKFALALRNLDWQEFDVLHAHGDDYWMWRRRVPVHVRTLHGSCFSEAIRIPGAREKLRMILLGLSELVASFVADQTVVVSEGTRRWTPWVRRVIPNGVDRGRFRSGQPSSVPSILFVGTFLRRKRGSLLVEIFEREVRPQLPEAELWMVAEDCPPSEGVRVIGRASDDELVRLYGAAWVFCLPSTYEGFGIPYVEAMAAGCPVVASVNPGSVEVTDNGRYGVLANDDELGAVLLGLLRSEVERARWSAKSRARAPRYDLVHVADEYELLYRHGR